jgi:acetyl/propionyl-CoA carboxylase alpha subunit
MSEPKEKQASVALTADDLKSLFQSVIEESRKPVITEEQRREIAEQQEARRQNVELQKEIEANRVALQNSCSHRHWENNKSRCVLVNVDKPRTQFLICQACQKVIYAHEEPALFNQLIQATAPAIF